MSKYFIDRNIWFQNKKQPPRKILLHNIYNNFNPQSVIAYDELDNEYVLEITEIFDDNDNPIKDARNRLGLSQAKFAEKFEIPKRTLEDWESGKSKPPKYVLNLLIEKVFAML